jgi:hypothetical protein
MLHIREFDAKGGAKCFREFGSPLVFFFFFFVEFLARRKESAPSVRVVAVLAAGQDLPTWVALG